VLSSDIGCESRKIRARIGGISCPPDHPRSLPIGILMSRVNEAASCSVETHTLRRTECCAHSLRQDVSERLRVFVLSPRGAVTDEAGDSTVKVSTVATVEKAVYTGARNLRVSLGVLYALSPSGLHWRVVWQWR